MVKMAAVKMLVWCLVAGIVPNKIYCLENLKTLIFSQSSKVNGDNNTVIIQPNKPRGNPTGYTLCLRFKVYRVEGWHKQVFLRLD